MKKIRRKVAVLAIISCIFVAILISFTSLFVINQLNRAYITENSRVLRDNFDILIKTEVQSTVSLLQALYVKSQQGEFSVDEAKSLGADLIRALQYGKDGYFWVDTSQGINVVFPTNPGIEGTDRSDEKDQKDNYYVRNLIQSAKTEGGDFTEYWFTKPGGNVPLPKRSYTLYFEPFDWVIGTGNYIDDIDLALQQTAIIAERSKGGIISILVFVTFLTVVLTGIFAYIAGILLTRPITNLTRFITRTAEFDLSDDSSFATLLKSRDEIGEMAKAVFEMRTALKGIISRLLNASNTLASHAKGLSATVDENVNTITYVASMITEIAEDNGEQANLIGNTNEAIIQVVKNIDEISNNASEKANEATSSLHIISSGKRTLDQQNQTMIENIAITKEIHSSITELSAMTEKVGEIVNIITSISSQTNLLALNATIEAARAGDAGLGFAVVADEIRSLAEDSAEAATKITQIIQDTLHKSRAAVTKINQAQAIISSQEHTVQLTRNVFEQIETTVGDVVHNVQHFAVRLKDVNSLSVTIADQSRNMAAISGESAARTEEISSSGEEQLASIEMVATAAQELSDISDQLVVELEKFKLQ